MFESVRLPEKYLKEIEAAGWGAAKGKKAYGVFAGYIENDYVVIEKMFTQPFSLGSSLVENIKGMLLIPWYAQLRREIGSYAKDVNRKGKRAILADYETTSSNEMPLPLMNPIRIQSMVDTSEIDAVIMGALNFLKIELTNDYGEIIKVIPRKPRKLI